jgi:zinc D-Ala-D-Ala carboxypeptidase
MQPITTSIDYFSEKELACKGTGVIKLDPRFTQALVNLREAWGNPLSPSSVCRTPEHNSKVKGHPNSFHLTENPKWKTFGTMAADITWRSWDTETKLKFARLAYSLGWAVGLHNSFCHIDRRVEAGLPQAVFLYGTWSGVFNKEDII